MEQDMREKIVNGLEHCIEKLDTVVNKTHGFNCTACPYFRKCDRSGYLIGLPLMRDVLALLKAQEPVEPVFERQFMSSIEIYDCGKCGTSLGAKGIAKYCMNCGQAVKLE